MEDNHRLITLAEIHALSGESNAALSLIEQAVQQGWIADKFHQWWILTDNPRLYSLSKKLGIDRVAEHLLTTMQQN